MKKRLLLVFVCAIALGGFAFGSSSLEASGGLFDSPLPEPLINDEFDQAIVIQTLPFTDYRDTTTATWSPDDPYDCYNSGSVWYAFTPQADMVLEANTFGSSYDTTLSAYTKDPWGALTLVPGACNDDYSGLQSRVTFQATAGTTYYFLVGICCGWGYDGGGSLVFTVQEILPPANDAFADAIAVTGVPYTHSTTVQGATLEPGEPLPGCAWDPTGSIWYAFSPAESASVMVDLQNVYYYTYVGVYTGESLESLAAIVSRCDWSNRLAFQASVGTTYYIQVGGMYGYVGPMTFRLVSTPPPEVSFWYDPYSPSIYDSIFFYASCWDPAGVGFATYEWDFGDGTTTTELWNTVVAHSYEADGEYLVELTATTYDGRTGSTSQLVWVETHDVAITEFNTPTRAEVGETKRIVIGLSNRGAYSENVSISLYKSAATGNYTWEGLASAYGTVPAHQANRTVDFEFSYTFTDEDAVAGKVSFMAMVSLSNETDALPADNQAISLPTLIKPLR